MTSEKLSGKVIWFIYINIEESQGKLKLHQITEHNRTLGNRGVFTGPGQITMIEIIY